MFEKKAYQLLNLFQEFYQEQKNYIKFFFRGEEAILIFLHKRKDKVTTPSQISDSLNISTARVAASLNSLETKGYITREIDQDDRRKIIIKLTKSGTKLATELMSHNLAKAADLLSKIGKKDSDELLRIFEKIKIIIKEEQILC